MGRREPRGRSRLRAAVVAASIVCAACGDPWIERDTQVVFAPAADSAVLAVTAPIVTARFPTDVASTTHNDSAIFVIDLGPEAPTYRRLIGINAVYDEGALMVSASFAEPQCRDGSFAFVLINTIRDTHDGRIGRARAFDDAFELRADDTTDGAFRPLRSALVDAGVELGGVAGATLFATATCE